MIYNNNGQYGRYPYQQQQPMQQMMYQQATNIQDMPIQAIKFMNEAEAKAYIVMPMGKELLVDREKGVAYLKSADNMGQSSCRLFTFKEVQESKPKTELDTSIFLTKDDTKNFVTQKDLEELKKQISALQTPKAVTKV